MKILFTLFGVIGSCLLGIAQLPVTSVSACGQQTSVADREILTRQRTAIQKYQRSAAKALVSIPLTIHLVARSNQQNALAEAELNKAISELNAQFLPANVQFFTCGIQLIAADDYFDFNLGLETEITQRYNVAGTLNLYFFNNIISASGLLCGYAYLPSADKEHIFLTNDCVTNGSTHLHEMGHYLGLYHTHGKSNQQLTDELVNGSNCSTTGDDVCDTPADPNVDNFSDINCNYTGSVKDANNETYQPDPRNIMSYGNNGCRDFFTDGQYQRIAYFAEQLGAQLECSDFAVDFTTDQQSEHCQSELTVQFTAVVTHPNSAALVYAWDIDDDGKTDYTTPHPQHTYTTAGTYTVALTVTHGGEAVAKTKKNWIELSPTLTHGFVDSLETGIKLWTVENPDEAMTWGVDATSACKDENGVVRFNNFNYNAIGQLDYLQSRRINLRYFSEPQLTFKLAYAPYSSNYSDELVVQVSTDCFVNDIRTVYQKKGSALATAGTSTVAFRPADCTDWRVDTVNLQQFEQEEISIRFVNINGYGNFIYLDNISVSNRVAAPLNIDNNRLPTAALDKQSTKVTETFIYPNPATKQIWVTTPPHKSRWLSYQISDTGGQVLQAAERKIEAEQAQFAIDVSGLVSGVYYLQTTDNQKVNSKIFTIF